MGIFFAGNNVHFKLLFFIVDKFIVSCRKKKEFLIHQKSHNNRIAANKKMFDLF